MSSFGTAGRELLLELRRGRDFHHDLYLPAYNTKLVRSCLEDLQHEVTTLQDELQALGEAQQREGGRQDGVEEEKEQPPLLTAPKLSMSVRPSILLHNAAIQRHKRCLLAYHKCRMDKIKRHVILGNNDESLQTLMNPAEQDFWEDYQQLRRDYAAAIGFDLNAIPPMTSTMVQVRVLQNLGQVVLGDTGRVVCLQKGSLHHLPRADVQDFLQAGTMEFVDGEEVEF